jgi:hypothetical protein
LLYRTTGTLKLLLQQHLAHTVWPEQPDVPTGIWIDRLEECPEELIGATPEEVTAVITFLRRRHPNGV